MKTKCCVLVLFAIVTAGMLGCSRPEQPVSISESKFIPVYCKVWGFLKYHHPAIADGNIDWDSTFITIYPKVKSATTKEEFNEALLLLYSKAEAAKKGIEHQIKPQDSGHKNVISMLDEKWMTNDDLFTDKVIASLQKTKNDFKSQYNHYISTVYGVGNPELKTDNAFYFSDSLTEAMHVLALARFWNIIEYFYPYKNVIGYPWDSTLYSFMPRFVRAKNDKEYQLLVYECAQTIKDGHAFVKSQLLSEHFGTAYLPFEFAMIEHKVTLVDFSRYMKGNGDSLLLALGLHKGDIVTKINGKNISDVRKEADPFLGGSNERSKDRNFCFRFPHGRLDSTITLSVENTSGVHEATLTFSNYPFFDERSDSCCKILPDNIGYIDLDRLFPNQIDSVMKLLGNTQALVIDVRNYPHFTMYDLMDHLSEPVPFVYCLYPMIFKPGYFATTDTSGIIVGKKREYTGKVVILANEMTQSHAEFTVMALQRIPGAKTIGSQTAGADGNVSQMYMPGGIDIWFTGLGIFYPDGTPTQHVGIKIDIESSPTMAGIRAGRDEVLERAIQYISNGN